MKKRVFSLFLLLCIMVSSVLPMTAMAAQQPTVEPQWVNTLCISMPMTFTDTRGLLVLSITGRPEVTRITAEVKFYYKNDAGSWVEIYTDWIYSVNDMLLREEETFTAVPGREYKAVMTAIVYKDGNGEYLTKTSTNTCPTPSGET